LSKFDNSLPKKSCHTTFAKEYRQVMETAERGYRTFDFIAPCKMEQGLRRKRIALSAPSEEVISGNEKGFAGILSSISKAQQQRQQLKNEFQKSNTLQYCLLEAGAETFELSLVYLRRMVGVLGLMRSAVIQRMPVLQSIPRLPLSLTEDPKIVELKLELLRLKEEMQRLSGSSSNSGVLHSQQSNKAEEQQLSRPLNRVLPFNADMLQSAKAQQKTPVKANEGSATARIQQKKRNDEPQSIQEVLQKALEEKFKNVRQAEKDDLDTSFDSDPTPRRSGVKPKGDITMDAKWRKPSAQTENRLGSKPPVPPRPKTMNRQLSNASGQQRRILLEHNG
jgi:hypothetical protein